MMINYMKMHPKILLIHSLTSLWKTQ